MIPQGYVQANARDFYDAKTGLYEVGLKFAIESFWSDDIEFYEVQPDWNDTILKSNQDTYRLVHPADIGKPELVNDHVSTSDFCLFPGEGRFKMVWLQKWISKKKCWIPETSKRGERIPTEAEIKRKKKQKINKTVIDF